MIELLINNKKKRNPLEFKKSIQFKFYINLITRVKMKIPLYDIVKLYERLVQEINVGEISVVVFCSLDSDSLCTLKILSRLMRGQNILYKVYPVSTYTELDDRIEDSKCYEKIKLFFFINCGGLIDLTTKWFAKQSYTFLFDVHKPIHHANVQAANIKIVDDEHSELDKAPTCQQAQLYLNMDDDLINGMEKKGLYDDDDDDQDEQIIAPKRKRQWDAQQQAERIQRIRKHRSIINQTMTAYYEANFYGLPSSYIIYRMIKDLQKNNNQYLWYAMVGATGTFLQQKITKQNFEMICDIYRSDMSKFNSHHLREGQDLGVVYEKNSIKRKLDFQFPVMRQWSLYDSIMNSPYMIAKLCLWEQVGINKLNQFLNLVGLSLGEAKQLFKYLSKQSTDKLEKDVLTCAQDSRFNLFDIAFDSFSKQIDYGIQFMASDYYYGLVAILERAPKTSLSAEDLAEFRIDCFWQAYTIFDGKQSVISEAIEQYKKMVSIITKQAKSLLQRNHIMYGQALSFVNILKDNQDRRIFEHPFTLIRLAHMLIGMIKQKKKQQFYKPFIASLQNNETNTTMMIGIMMDTKNSFGTKFEKVVDKLNIDVTMNSFNPNIMTLPKESMVQVIRELGEADKL